MKKYKKVVACLLTFLMILTLDFGKFRSTVSAATITWSDECEPYESNKIEGEFPTATNFPVNTGNGESALSGGKFFLGKTAAGVTAPDDGYNVTYNVTLPSAGKYIIDFIGSPIDWNYTSPYEIQINDGPSVPLDSKNTKLIKYVDTNSYGTGSSSAFRKYSYKPVYFNQGANTVTFRVKKGRQSDGRYFLYLDKFTINPVSSSVEGEKFDTLNFTPSTHVTDNALSNGDFLCLDTVTEPAVDGYIANCKIFAPAAGKYKFNIVGSPFSGSETSPFSIKINDGAYVDISNNNVTSSQNVATTIEDYSGKFQSITTNPVFDLKAGINAVSFKVNQKSSSGMKYLFYLDKFTATYFEELSYNITTNIHLNIFTTEDSKVFNINLTEATSEDLKVAYNVKDYWSNVTTSGSITIAAGQKSGQVDLGTLPIGHYRFGTSVSKDSFTYPGEAEFSVVKPLSERSTVASSPFAVDYASSMLVNKSKVDDYARSLQLAGIDWVRERYNWSVTNPSTGVYDYSNYEPYINSLNNKGINSLQLFYNTPAWNKSNGNLLPDLDKLFEAYNFGKTTASYFGDKVPAWEIWNEPDIGFTKDNEAADKIAAYTKAISIGYKDSGANPLVSMPGIAYPPSGYYELYMQNEVAPYIDIYNFHAHRSDNDGTQTLDIPSAVAQNMDFAEKYDLTGKKIWASEVGVYQPLTTGAVDATFDQQKKLARYVVEAAVSTLSKGVDKFFFFVWPYYVESGRSMGVFSNNNTPYAGYNAEAVMTDELGEGIYKGTIKDVPAGVNAHVFKNSGNSIAVLWSENTTQVTLTTSKNEAVLTDIMGSKQTLNQTSGNYTLQVGPDPIYFRIEGEFPAASINAAKTFAKASEPKVLTPAERIVIAQEYTPEASTTAKADGYMLNRGSNEIKIRVYNFNNKEITGSISGDVFGNGWTLDKSSQDIVLQPNSMATLTFKVSDTAETKGNITSSVKFAGTFNGEKTTASVANIALNEASTITVDRLFPNFNAETLNSLNKPGGDVMVAGGTYVITDAVVPGTNQTAVKFKYNFPATGGWVYPYLYLPAGSNFIDTAGITCKVYATEDMPQVTFRFMANEVGGTSYMNLTGFKFVKGWNEIYVPWSKINTASKAIDSNFHLDLDQITSVQVGLNTTATDLPAFYVCDFGVYKQPDSDIYSKLTEVYPADKAEIINPKPVITAAVSASDIDIKPGTIKVTVDGKVVPGTYDAQTRKINAQAPSLAIGKHSLVIKYYDEINRVVQSSTEFTTTIVSASLASKTGNFDKNTTYAADVAVGIELNSATTVTDVKSGDTSIGEANYSFTNGILTINKEYLDVQTNGSLPLTIEFDYGNPAAYTITVCDTTPIITISSPTADNFKTTDKFIVNYTVQDEGSGIVSILATLNGQPVTNGQDISLAGLAGRNTFVVTAIDKAGNTTEKVVEFDVVIAAIIEITPGTLNLNSKGGVNSVTAEISLPAFYQISGIDVSTVVLNISGKSIQAPLSPVEVNDNSLTVKFDRKQIISALLAVNVNINVNITGCLKDGRSFSGNGTINIIH